MQTIVLPLDHHQVALLPKSPLTFQRKVATAEARLESLQVMKIVFPSNHEAPDGATAGPPLDYPEAENLPTGPRVGVHPRREMLVLAILAGVHHPHQTRQWPLPGEILSMPQTKCHLRQVDADIFCHIMKYLMC